MKQRKDFVPDLSFIQTVKKNGGDALKNCYQCATCSVVCSLSRDSHPFPRKEMLLASWGARDKLLASPDIWLCHNCGDCSQRCPRGARPGDVLAALRRTSMMHYAKPGIINRFLGDPRWLPVLFIVPALVILAVGQATGLMGFPDSSSRIVFADFFPVILIEMIFIPLSLLVTGVMAMGLRRFIADMTRHYADQGLVDPFRRIDLWAYLKTLVSELPGILRHDKFAACSHRQERKLSHMMVSFSFICLAFVAGAFVFALYALNQHGPYPQTHPVKILANLAGIALIIGAVRLMMERAKDSLAKSLWADWHLLILALLLGVTGMMTQLARIMDQPWPAFGIYFVHLVLAFNLIAFLPYGKLAHFVYRTAAVVLDIHVRNQPAPMPEDAPGEVPQKHLA